MDPTKVSVVIPTFRRPGLLMQAMDSVLAQKLKPAEIIVVESPSDSRIPPDALPSGVSLISSSVRLLPGDARNLGARHSSGDFLAFLDDDDLWDSEYLWCMSQEIELQSRRQKAVDFLFGHLFDEAGKSARNRHFSDPFSSYWVNPGITGSNMVFRREFFNKIGGFDGAMSPSEDREIVIRALQNSDAVYFVPGAISTIRAVSTSRVSSRFLKGNLRVITRHWKSHHRSDRTLAIFFVLLRVAVMIVSIPRTSWNFFRSKS